MVLFEHLDMFDTVGHVDNLFKKKKNFFGQFQFWQANFGIDFFFDKKEVDKSLKIPQFYQRPNNENR